MRRKRGRGLLYIISFLDVMYNKKVRKVTFVTFFGTIVTLKIAHFRRFLDGGGV